MHPYRGDYIDFERFYVTTIDMAANEGRGKVTSKNVLTDLRSKEGEQNPIRHANGKDWWVIAPLRDTNQYALYLVDSSGVSLHSIQKIGNVDNRFDRGGGQSTFTPMGDMYLRYHSNRGMQIFDFDRTTGQLSNFRFVEMPLRDQPAIGWGGLGISPNGRFAYASNIFFIFQYDLWADDIAASRIQVGEVGNPDSLWVGVAPTAFNFQLGPDCKLYNFTNTGFKHHVIHNPDEKGRACDWEQNWLVLPTNGFRDIPFFPNFRLGPLGKEGSPCANPIVSTRPDPPPTLQHLTVFPNPTQGAVSLSLSGSFPYARSVWQLFDGRGQLVRREVLSRGGVTRTEGLQLPAGMYFWQLTGSGRTLGQGKLVIR